MLYFVSVNSYFIARSFIHEPHRIPNIEQTLHEEEAVCLKSGLCVTRVKKKKGGQRGINNVN